MPRDDFPPKIIDKIPKRAAFTCSNPNCENLCIGPAETDLEKVSYFGKVAHISAASKGGPRYDSSLTSEERKSVENAIFLCSNCADMIDKNKGVDYSIKTLREWKFDHEKKIRERISTQKPLKKTVDKYTGAEYDGLSKSEIKSYAILGQNHFMKQFIDPVLQANRDRAIFKLNKRKIKKNKRKS